MSFHDVGTLHAVLAQAVAAIVLGLLGASGIAKLVDPEPTTGAMRVAGLPASNFVSRLLGLTEVCVAVLALAVGGIAVVAGAVLYIGFAVFTFSAVKNRIPLQSCGCFGREDTPPTAFHVGFNVLAALALIALVPLALDPIDWSMPLNEMGAFLAFTGIGVYLSYLLLTLLPRLQTAWRAP